MEEECENQDGWVKWVIKGIVGGRERRELALMYLMKKISKRVLENEDMPARFFIFLLFFYLWMSPEDKCKSIYFEWLILLWNPQYPAVGMLFPMSV